VHLTLRRTDVDFRPGTRGTAAAVATLLNSLVATADGAMATVVNDVYALSDEDAVKAMQSMSGLHYQHVATGGLAEVRRFMHVNLGRLGQPVPGDAIAAVPGQRNSPGWWFRVLDSRTRLTGGDGDPGADMPSSGLALGVDGRIGQSLTIGVSGARTTPHFVQDDFGDRTSARMLHVGVYGSYRHRASRLDAAFVASEQDLTTRREITIGAPSFAEGAYDGHARSWRAEFGHAVRASDVVRVEGVIGAHVDALTTDAIDEHGDGVVSLRVPERALSSRRSVLGARVERSFTRASGFALRLEGRALWMHEFAEPNPVRMQFAGDANTGGFEMAPITTGREGGLLSATFYGDTRGGFRAFADVTFETSGQVKSLMASLGIGRRW